MIRSLWFVVAAAALAACSAVGPNYRVPPEAKANLPAARAKFLGANSAGVEDKSAVPGHWWQLYRDATLNQLVAGALADNTGLREAAANLARARDIADEAKAARNPTLNFSASAERARVSGESYLLDTSLPVENLADAGAGISYQVDVAGRLKRTIELANATAEASAAALDLARTVIAARVTQSYLEICAANEEQDAAEHLADLRQKHLMVTEALVSGGRGTDIDVRRARAQLDAARAALPLYAARRKAALYELAALMGRVPADYPKEAEACAVLPKLARPIPVGDGAALLKRRPDVRVAERELAAATARIGIATADLYPRVALGAGLGSTGILEDIGTSATNRWSIGGLITWSFPGPAAHARVREAKAGAAGALAHFDSVVLNALKETETALNGYAEDLDRNGRLEAARAEEAQAVADVKTLYAAGRAPYVSSLEAETTLAQSDLGLAAERAQLAADQVRLFLALGGGWQQGSPAAAKPTNPR